MQLLFAISITVSPPQPGPEGPTLRLPGIVQADGTNGHGSMRSGIGSPPTRLPSNSAFNIYQKAKYFLFTNYSNLLKFYDSTKIVFDFIEDKS